MVWYSRTEHDDTCVLCKQEKDSVEHFLFSCSALNRERLSLLNEISVHARGNIFIENGSERERLIWALLKSNDTDLDFKCSIAWLMDQMLKAKMEIAKATDT